MYIGTIDGLVFFFADVKQINILAVWSFGRQHSSFVEDCKKLPLMPRRFNRN